MVVIVAIAFADGGYTEWFLIILAVILFLGMHLFGVIAGVKRGE
jgi:hypothetical protein